MNHKDVLEEYYNAIKNENRTFVIGGNPPRTVESKRIFMLVAKPGDYMYRPKVHKFHMWEMDSIEEGCQVLLSEFKSMNMTDALVDASITRQAAQFKKEDKVYFISFLESGA